MSVEPVIEYAVVSMAPEEAVSEEHGTFTMPEEIPEDDSAVYFVTEVEETVTETVDPASIADDVVTVGSEFASTPVNFEVEEPITEGRRTEVRKNTQRISLHYFLITDHLAIITGARPNRNFYCYDPCSRVCC